MIPLLGLFLVFVSSFSFAGVQSPSRGTDRINQNAPENESLHSSISPTSLRIWFISDSSDWDKNEQQTFLYANDTNGDKASYTTTEFGKLSFCDVPITTSSYGFFKGESISKKSASTRSFSLSANANSRLNIIKGSWTSSVYISLSDFRSDFLTASVLNKILEGYFPYRNSAKNGYLAFYSLKNYLLNNYVGGEDALSQVSHWTLDEDGKEIEVTAAQKIEMLKTQYGTINEKIMVFGGYGGLFLAIMLLVAMAVGFAGILRNKDN